MSETTNKKIGPFLLSGLMVGPILGSGIVLLPPLAYGLLGKGSIWAWLIIMALGALFAMIFSKLSILHPGDGGMTNAIEVFLGKKYKLFASLLMLFAVSFGPTAVMLTASDYLIELNFLRQVPKPAIAIVLVLISFAILMKDLKFISTLSFVLSTGIAVVLLISAVYVLMVNGVYIEPLGSVDPLGLGRVVLLLFWAIIGWEIVGNYSDQVADLKKTIPQATLASVIIITGVYLIVALSIQSFAYTESLSLIHLIQPIFGGLAPWILALLVTGLCLCTYLLIVGALARLMANISEAGYLPKKLSFKNDQQIPTNGIKYFVVVHCLVLVLNILGILDIEKIVNIANGFFLLNALVGLVAAAGIIKSFLVRLSCLVLIISLTVLLAFSTWDIFVGLVFVYVLTSYLYKRKMKSNH